MCGLAGYAGKEKAKLFLLDALRKLEYRGYDSYGFAVFDGSKIDEVYRSIGKQCDYKSTSDPAGAVGIAHNRWASVGKVSEANAHPIQVRTTFIVHNGNVENHQHLKQTFEQIGCVFNTETDTEIIACLLNYYLAHMPIAEAIVNTCSRLEGSYAFLAYDVRCPGYLMAACNGLPIVFDPHGHIASEPQVLAERSQWFGQLPDKHFAIFDAEGVMTASFSEPQKTFKPAYDKFIGYMRPAGDAEGGAMWNEIHEEPAMLEKNKISYPYRPNPPPKRYCLFGCGSSYHAALVARHYANIPVTVEYATDLAEKPWLFDVEDTLFIGLTQSGETKDTLRAIERVKQSHGNTLVITNNRHSQAARMSNFYDIGCGIERGVAATKTFVEQVMALFRMFVSYSPYAVAVREQVCCNLPSMITDVLGRERQLCEFASQALQFKNHIYLGRGPDYPIAMEAALKVKEVAYIHAEAIHSSEMKHGPLALIDDTTLSVFILTGNNMKTVGNIREIIARGGTVFIFCDPESYETAWHVIKSDDVFNVGASFKGPPILFAVAFQLYAYYLAKLQNLDPDKPRSLAKAVTVE